MPHSNRCTARYLSLIMDAHHWTQLILAGRTGISQPSISRHISGEHAIRRKHLPKYLAAIDPTERNELVAAWLKDLGLDCNQIMKSRRKQPKQA
jgi:hypothetical protein